MYIYIVNFLREEIEFINIFWKDGYLEFNLGKKNYKGSLLNMFI